MDGCERSRPRAWEGKGAAGESSARKSFTTLTGILTAKPASWTPLTAASGQTGASRCLKKMKAGQTTRQGRKPTDASRLYRDIELLLSRGNVIIISVARAGLPSHGAVERVRDAERAAAHLLPGSDTGGLAWSLRCYVTVRCFFQQVDSLAKLEWQGGGAVNQEKQRIVVTRKVPDPLVPLLCEQGRVEVVMCDSVEPMLPEELVEFVRGAHAIVSIADDKITPEVFDAAGADLKIVANYAVGYDNVDISAAVERDVWVTHTVGVEKGAVCELTFGLALSLMRGIVLGDRLVREGKFKYWDAFRLLGPELYRHTLGIVGLGQIGSTVAERAKGFSMRVIYYDVLRKHKLEEAIGVEYVSLDEVVVQADVVTLHVPLTQETRRLVDEGRLSKMKPTAYLLNLCRGPVVDEAALVGALKNGRIAGAALDVYGHEPKSDTRAGRTRQRRIDAKPGQLQSALA